MGDYKGLGSMKLFTLLIILLIGCSGARVPIKVPVVTPAIPIIIIPLPVQPIVSTPIREMDLVHQKIQDYTVALVNIQKDIKETSATSYCTGVWVGVDEILTAAHCVNDEEKKPWKGPVGDPVTYVIKKDIDISENAIYHDSRVIAFDNSVDLALIQAEGVIPTHLVTLLPTELPAIGEIVYQVGHPHKLYWSFSSGEVSAYRHSGEIGDVIQANISIWYGNSGGGLFDRDGKLIGICSRKLEIPSMGYYVHLDSIKRFLDGAHLIRGIKELR
jgi:S1-C subfamily serine protease